MSATEGPDGKPTPHTPVGSLGLPAHAGISTRYPSLDVVSRYDRRDHFFLPKKTTLMAVLPHPETDEHSPCVVDLDGDGAGGGLLVVRGSAVFTPDGEVAYRATVRRKAARFSLRPVWVSDLLAEGRAPRVLLTPEQGVGHAHHDDAHDGRRDRGRRARVAVMDHAVANDLRMMATLTYRDERSADECSHHVTTFLRRLRRREPGLPWVEVTEGGASHRLHHHVLLPGRLDAGDVDLAWDNGSVDVAIANDAEGIRRLAMYVTKGFETVERTTSARYRISRGNREDAEIIFTTAKEISAFVDVLAERGKVRVLDRPNDFCHGVIQWDPQTPKGS